MRNEARGQASAELLGLTAYVVAAYVRNNATPVAGIPDLIARVNSSAAVSSAPHQRRN
ncbi:hypothetical protein [Mesorhizobium sp. L103C105A0]|uniref:hypothetical protein n=1 Tax=Mesorhizobium sp. L103C105A0 TaxID=1287074 RepID=UPI0004167160|nr:hypothetical protein [Mesorhizobium sp. L103C105A0]